MTTDIKVPSGKMGAYSSVRLNTDLSGEHHEMLLSAPEQLFERTVASVIGTLMDGGDVYKISLCDLVYLFFIVRASSVGPTYKSEWKCKREVTVNKGTKQECGCSNTYVLNLAKLPTKFMKDSFEYPKIPITVDGVTTTVHVRFLTILEEFDVLDTLQDEGITKEMLRETANAYKYALYRILRAMTFADPRLTDYSLEKKDIIRKALPLSIVNQLFTDMRELDSYGPDLTAKSVTCSKCKGESRLSIPFSGQLFLP